MKEFLIILGVFFVWFALQRWILPALGVPTWMSGSCSVEQKQADEVGAESAKEVLHDKGQP